MPIKTTLPNLGKKWGRRERESRRGGRRERSLREKTPPRVVTVKGIPVFWKAALFAGRRWNGGLGRSVGMQRSPPLRAGAPVTADVQRAPRRGTSSACATKRMHPTQAREIVACARETRPSLGPLTRARRSSLCTSRSNPLVVRRSIRHHGWANPRKWEEPALGLKRTDGARLAASHRSVRRRREASEKEGGRGLRPREDTGARVWLPARRSLLQKSAGDVWSRIRSANALQKERSGSSERGPSSGRTLAGGTVSG